MEWKTRVTELAGCKYPILQGAFSGLGNWRFAAAVSETGALGCITASVSRTPDRLRDDIRRLRDVTDRPFSVNLTVGFCPHPDEMIEVILEEGVPILETAAYKADVYGKRAKEAGILWIHKVATVKHCKKAEEQGADAVIIVGLEGTGFKSVNQLPTLLSGIMAARQTKIPVILAGGIGDGRGLLAALATGAQAIMMGTAFMATEEAPISKRVKDQMVNATADHPKIKYECLAMPNPADYEEISKLRDQIPMEKWLTKLESVMLKRTDWKKIASMLDMPNDEIAGLQSMAVEYIHRVRTCKELVEDITMEAEMALSTQFKVLVDLATS